jgi:chitin disaccharide deacetylase
LIVNADDLGLGTEDTDAILSCWSRGSITSATAMVWMQDSIRALELARAAELPVGLHLNLIEPFSAPDVPEDQAVTQRRVIDRLRSGRRERYLYHPRWAPDFERCIAAQLSRFVELYGRAPTHVDGHQHMHLVPNALLSRALGPVERCRRPVNRTREESRASRRVARAMLARAVRLRFTTTDRCFSIRALDPALGGTGVADKLASARRESVEVYLHPGWEDEFAVLDSPAWLAALAEYPVGSYLDLAARRRRVS